jgi:4-amino-4-deoxy-L-arabinose transferase-like glycosyltransferase
VFERLQRGVATRDWRVSLALILLVAIAIRVAFFVGFGLGDDPTYVDYAGLILSGRYPPLDPVNQYAYRPLLLLLFAGGIRLFGYTDVGVVAPVLAASTVTTVLVVVFVRKLIAAEAAWWCGLLMAFEPLNVIDATTMTSDVILSALVFGSGGLFLIADRERTRPRRVTCFVAAGTLMVAAFLVKITFLPALLALALYTLFKAAREPGAIARHATFYVAFAAGMACVCAVYYVRKGDFLWQFRSEFTYYRASGPPDPPALLDYRAILLEYPRSLWGRSGYERFTYFEHGLVFWVFVPAAIWQLARRRDDAVSFFIFSTLLIFAFFEFYPQELKPQLVLLGRQNRYLELLVPGAVVVAGTALHRMSATRHALAVAVLCVVLGHAAIEANRRHTQYVDSQRDVRDLARFAASAIAPSGKCLALDEPAYRALAFYLRDTPICFKVIRAIQSEDLRDCYVALGGARSFWWSHESVVDAADNRVPAAWRLVHRLDASPRPWRLSSLRVYYVPRVR